MEADGPGSVSPTAKSCAAVEAAMTAGSLPFIFLTEGSGSALLLRADYRRLLFDLGACLLYPGVICSDGI